MVYTPEGLTTTRLLHLMHRVHIREVWAALCWKEVETYELEETKFYGPNVVSFRLITGRCNYYVVGCYIPPSDDEETTLDR